MRKERKSILDEDPAGFGAPRQCIDCLHFVGYSEEAKDVTCKTFPRGIPDDYLFDMVKHDFIDPSQDGTLIFKQDPDLL